MAHNTTNTSLPGGDHPPADAGDEAFLLELPKQDDLSWVERGWLSAFEDTAAEPKSDPAGGELSVGLTGDLYYYRETDDYIRPGTPEKLDDAPGEQLMKFLMMEAEPDAVDNTPVSLE